MLSKLIKYLFGKEVGKERGLTLVEAMVATVIMGVGFTGVYTISAMSSQSMSQSIAKQKMQMQANQILDVIGADRVNVDNYVLDISNCVEPDAGELQTSVLRAYEWCSRLEGEVGPTSAGDERSVNITTLGDGRKVVHITLESGSGTVKVVMKRIYDN